MRGVGARIADRTSMGEATPGDKVLISAALITDMLQPKIVISVSEFRVFSANYYIDLSSRA
jgi:hypothetical protein